MSRHTAHWSAAGEIKAVISGHERLEMVKVAVSVGHSLPSQEAGTERSIP